MVYGKGPIKMGRGKPSPRLGGDPRQPKTGQPKSPLPKNMDPRKDPRDGIMYTGGTPYFDERTGMYRNIKPENFGNLDQFDTNPISRDAYKKAKLKKKIIVGPPARRRPFQPKVGR